MSDIHYKMSKFKKDYHMMDQGEIQEISNNITTKNKMCLVSPQQ